jgi:hypothetical protein
MNKHVTSIVGRMKRMVPAMNVGYKAYFIYPKESMTLLMSYGTGRLLTSSVINAWKNPTVPGIALITSIHPMIVRMRNVIFIILSFQTKKKEATVLPLL